ncbi:MAG: ribosome small subunit-dependent GTPase A [Ferruginibacter sp.]
MKAIVYKSTGSWYVVKPSDPMKVPDGQGFYNARLKGVFKIDGSMSTNPIAVGDEVEIEMENELEGSVTISGISKRRNYVNRQSPRSEHHHHIIASNLDQSLLIATLKEPKTSQGFIDRFLVGCEAYHIPAIIVFNKADLYHEKELDKFEALQEMYERIGYKVLQMSIEKNEGVDKVIALLKDKLTLVSGHSGVGKSTFINTVLPEKKLLRTSEVSNWSGKGMHTTTFAEMFDLPSGGKIIDTPGIREFGIVDISKEELSHYFPEMRRILNDCQFNNCMHINEPGCAVKEAVNNGTIAVDRYASYLTILDTIKEKKY